LGLSDKAHGNIEHQDKEILMVPETSGNGGYNASSITILEGLSAVRKRPAM